MCPQKFSTSCAFLILAHYSKAEMANSIKTWTPADYVNAAGRSSEGQPAPNAMDFMSRLNSNVKVAVEAEYSTFHKLIQNLICFFFIVEH